MCKQLENTKTDKATEILREHWVFAVDMPEHIANNSAKRPITLSLIEDLLQQQVEEGHITKYHFHHNFDEDVTDEYDTDKTE